MKKTVLILLSYVLVATMASALTLGIQTWKGEGESKLEQLSRLIDLCYIEDVDVTELEDAAAEAMLNATGDRWGYYVPADEMISHKESVENAYVGIGITITVDEDMGGFRIVEVSDAGSAGEAGLQVGDVIIAIEGQAVAGMTTLGGRNLVRGEEGTQVAITLLRGEEEMEFSVTRRKVEVAVAVGQMLGNGIGLIAINNFDDRCASETIAAIEELQKQGMEKLIFDVRGNPGGYATELVRLLDYLLPEGDLFRTVDYRGKETVDTSDAKCLQIPMAVLVNGDSYSAAEFFAVALQEYEAAIVVGEKTTGKGYFQNMFHLNDGSGAAISTGKYYTPKGISMEGVGITPDVEIKMDEETMLRFYYGQLTAEEDPQIRAAVEVLLAK